MAAILKITEMVKPEVFVSYAWGGESEQIVNNLDSAFQKQGIVLIRDKRDLGFKGMITEFMQRIGVGLAVVTVISDKYLKSPYCMFELLEIYRNLNFKKRIFPIVLDDAKIFDPILRLQYLKYWQDKKKELDDCIMRFGLDAITVIGEDYKIYKKIYDNYGEIVNILKDINSLTADIQIAADFNIMIKEVEKLITKEEPGDEIQLLNDRGLEKKERIDTSLKDVHNNRKKLLMQRLERLYKLLDEYENQLMLIGDPREKMSSENEIEKLNEQIQRVETDINKI